MNRYKRLYEQQQKISKALEDKLTEYESKNRDLQWQLDCLLDSRTDEGLTAAEEAKAEIATLKDEVARLTARLETNSTNAGISTAKTSINQEKYIPNSREKSNLKKGGKESVRKCYTVNGSFTYESWLCKY